MIFLKSKCKGTYLHKFANINAKENAVLERCVKCGKRHVIRLVKGEPHIVDYARYHQREFLIPQHRLFLHEFQKIKQTRYG
jgi:hypothetical protein